MRNWQRSLPISSSMRSRDRQLRLQLSLAPSMQRLWLQHERRASVSRPRHHRPALLLPLRRPSRTLPLRCALAPSKLTCCACAMPVLQCKQLSLMLHNSTAWVLLALELSCCALQQLASCACRVHLDCRSAPDGAARELAERSWCLLQGAHQQVRPVSGADGPPPLTARRGSADSRGARGHGRRHTGAPAWSQLIAMSSVS